jgi:hypothetical protein
VLATYAGKTDNGGERVDVQKKRKTDLGVLQLNTFSQLQEQFYHKAVPLIGDITSTIRDSTKAICQSIDGLKTSVDHLIRNQTKLSSSPNTNIIRIFIKTF